MVLQGSTLGTFLNDHPVLWDRRLNFLIFSVTFFLLMLQGFPIVVRKDIRDPLATMKDLFVSFRFIEPSSDNLRLIINLENTIFIQKLHKK